MHNNILNHLHQELDENKRKFKELDITIEKLTFKIDNMQSSDEFYKELTKMRNKRLQEKEMIKAAILRLSSAIESQQ